jgi:NitT/TauT family transport system ATP-binding protein
VADAERTQERRSGSGSSIVAQGVEHLYETRTGPVRALDNIDLIIPGGQLVALLGPSGCGKSTLLRILSGLLRPTAGQAFLAGEPPEHANRRYGFGWLAQDDGLLPWRSVAANVALALQIGGRDRVRTDDERVLEMIGRVDLLDSLGRFPHELSGGMRQRAALARAIVNQPAFLFLDEPFANLDELIRERLGDLLLEVRGAFRPTTLLVTHSVTEAVRLADRVVVFSARPGRVIADVGIDLNQPRSFDHTGFGTAIEELKHALQSNELAGREGRHPGLLPVRKERSWDIEKDSAFVES